MKAPLDDLDFTFRATKDETVLISRSGRLVTTVRGLKALTLIKKLEAASFPQQQQLLARVTGNYKRGNERK